MSENKFIIGKAPFVRRADFNKINTQNIMINFLISLIPLILFAWYKNGISLFIKENTLVFNMFYPLIFILIGGCTSFFIEALYYLIILKEEDCFKRSLNNYSIIPGLLLSMLLPITTPIWVLVIGVAFAVVIGKMLFGGFGYNIFNPALIGYIFILSNFYNIIVSNNHLENIDIISSATPLSNLNSLISGNVALDEVINKNGGLLNMFIGNTSGAIGETSALLCIIAFLFLSYKKAINPLMTIIYLLTCFIYSFILGMFINIDELFKFALFNILNGGIMFASVFMITEPVTSPRNINAKYIYTFFIAILSITLRFLSDAPEGISTAILFMNMLSPSLDTLFAKIDVSNNKIKKITTYIIVFIISILIILFTIFRLLEKR